MPKTKVNDDQFILDLSHELFALNDAFDMVRAFGSHVLAATSANQALLSWPDTSEGFSKAIRTETLGSNLSKRTAAHKRWMTVRFFDGELTFIKIDFFGQNQKIISLSERKLIAKGAKLVNQAVIQLQKNRREEELRRFSSIRTLSAGIAHELNTPLNTLLFFLKALEKNGDSSGNVPKIRLSAERIGETLNRFRSFTGDGDLEEFKPVPVTDVLKKIKAQVTVSTKQTQILFLNTKGIEDLQIETRSGQIEHVLMAIVQNALDSFERHPVLDPCIKISFDASKDHLRIKVTDNGKGIPVEHRSAIFDPFYSTKEVNQGLGLGLSIARAIAFSHNGMLFFNPLTDNTQFVLELPLWRKQAKLKQGA